MCMCPHAHAHTYALTLAAVSIWKWQYNSSESIPFYHVSLGGLDSDFRALTCWAILPAWEHILKRRNQLGQVPLINKMKTELDTTHLIAGMVTLINNFDEGWCCWGKNYRSYPWDLFSHHRKSYSVCLQTYPDLIICHCLHGGISKTVVGLKRIILDINWWLLTPQEFSDTFLPSEEAWRSLQWTC